MFKKILSFLICLTMVLSFVPAMAEDVAEGTTEATLTNVALNKPVTAGRYIDVTTKDDINDGDVTTGVYSVPTATKTDDPDGITAIENDWYQIDLGEKYQIDNVVLRKDRTNWYTGYNFKIMVSNSPDFSDETAVSLATYPDKAPFVAIEETEDDTDAKLVISGDGNSYRYIRLQRMGYPSYERYTELEVWVDESTIIKPVNVALNKPITAGCYDPTWIKPSSLNDGSLDTFVYHGGSQTHNTDGVPSAPNQAWYQIDLGARYQIENVTMIFGSGYTGTDFKISLSNSKDFSDAVVIASETHAVSSPYQANGNGKSYRYVRWERVPGPTSNLGGYGHNNFQELEVYAFEETAVYPGNVAVNKPITAGAYDMHNHPKERLNDGNVETSVNYSTATSDNADGVASGKTDAWFQIDLGARYQVENVTLLFNSWTSGADFKISVSNSPDFSDGTAKVIATEGDSKILPSPYVAECDGGYYRYVRWERIDGAISRDNGYVNFQEIEVYAFEDTAIHSTNIAVNKPITAGVYQDKGGAMKKSWLNDGDKTTVLDYTASPDAETDNADGKVSSKTDAWFQIDLGARYLVEKIQLWYNTSSADYVIPYNFNILVSNSPDFSDGKAVTLKSVGNEGIEAEVKVVTEDGVTRKLITVTGDGNYYRYVRWERTPGDFSQHGYSGLAELEAYAFPENVKNEVITIDTPVYYINGGMVKIPYAVENLETPKTLTAYVAVKDTNGKLLAIGTGDIKLDVDKSTTTAILIGKNMPTENIIVYVWENMTPVAGGSFQLQIQ